MGEGSFWLRGFLSCKMHFCPQIEYFLQNIVVFARMSQVSIGKVNHEELTGILQCPVKAPGWVKQNHV